MEYFNKYKEAVDKKKMFEALLNRDAKTFSGEVTELLQKFISYQDKDEKFYHGLILGLLNVGAYYDIKSNRESGDGRYGIMMFQKDRPQNAVILEFKMCRDNEFI